MSNNCVMLITQPLAIGSNLVLGQDYKGGTYFGMIVIDDQVYALIITTPQNCFTGLPWRATYGTDGPLSQSVNDGWSNCNAFNDADHPIIQKVRSLTINGYNDWYVGSRDEMELFYRHFKCTDTPNWVGNSFGRPNGQNLNSYPPGAPYTAADPAVTQDVRFQLGGSLCLAEFCVTSTEPATSPHSIASWYYSSTYAGLQTDFLKDSVSGFYTRPIRRELIGSL